MTNTRTAAGHLHPTGGQKDDGSKVDCVLRAHRVCCDFADDPTERFSLSEMQTNYD